MMYNIMIIVDNLPGNILIFLGLFFFSAKYNENCNSFLIEFKYTQKWILMYSRIFKSFGKRIRDKII